MKFRILPAIADLAAGKYSIGDVRDIDIDDLLRRSPVPADPELMRSVIDGRVILDNRRGRADRLSAQPHGGEAQS